MHVKTQSRLRHTAIRRWQSAAVCLCAALVVSVVDAATLSSELQKRVRSTTFEVVTPKPTADTLRYEKPLPLELIPFTERNDKYWSIGTAFAIDNESFVSAAHVFMSALGSRLGSPALRDASGKVYPVDKVLKFSLHEDFIVFTVQGLTANTPLAVNRTPQVDDAVFAVGNALGDGIVIRDGLFTSETAEQQDGRWKWIRFSAAASPGNSGGPLLDANGNAIGIVIGKSDNENLNYALPIGRLIDAPAKLAQVDTRWLQHIPLMNATGTATWKEQFDLPKTFEQFSKTYIAAVTRANIAERKRVADANAEQRFPKGKGSNKVLSAVVDARFPKLIAQRNDDSWHLLDASERPKVELEDHGFVRIGHAASVALAQLRVSGSDIDPNLYRDTVVPMDQLLKALQLERHVGPDVVRITSLGPARSDSLWTDDYGRRWQVRVWSLDFMNADLIAFMLPVPSGYIALIDTTQPAMTELTLDEMRAVAQHTYLTYSGSIKQWRVFLAQKNLRPALFDRIKLSLDEKTGITYQSARIELQIPPTVIPTVERNQFMLRTAFMMEKDKLRWDVAGIALSDDAQEQTFFMATRVTKPDADAEKESEQEWLRLSERRPPYNNVSRPNPDHKSFWISTSAGAWLPNSTQLDPKNTVLYQVTYSTDADLLPRDIDDRQRQVLRGLRVLER